MVRVKCFEEVEQNLIFGLLALDHIRVLFRVVGVADVVDVEETATVDIEDLEGLHAEVFTELVHFTADAPEELVVADLAVALSIEKFG